MLYLEVIYFWLNLYIYNSQLMHTVRIIWILFANCKPGPFTFSGAEPGSWDWGEWEQGWWGLAMSCWSRVTPLGRSVFPKISAYQDHLWSFIKTEISRPRSSPKQWKSWGVVVGQHPYICILKNLPKWFWCPGKFGITTLDDGKNRWNENNIFNDEKATGHQGGFMEDSKLRFDKDVFIRSVFYWQN